MPRAHFTVGEVEALVPALERIFVDVLQLRAGLRALGDQLDRANVRMSREEILESDDGPPEVRQAKAVFRGFYEALSDEIDAHPRAGRRGEGRRDRPGRLPGAARGRGDPALLALRREEHRLLAPASTAASPRGRPIDAEMHERPAARGLRRRRWTPRRNPTCGAAVEALLRAAGRDPAADPDLARDRPPRRAALAGRVPGRLRHGSRRSILGDPVLGEADPDVVVVGGLRFHAMCPHHLLPYRGRRARRLPPARQAGRASGGSPSWSTASPSGSRCRSARRTRSPTRSAATSARAAPAASSRPSSCAWRSPARSTSSRASSPAPSWARCASAPTSRRGCSRRPTSGGARDERRPRPAPTGRRARRQGRRRDRRVARHRPRHRRAAGRARARGRRLRAARRARRRACDVRLPDDVERFAADVLRRLGPPDILVNNAGTVARARLDETSVESWDAVVDANLKGTFLVTRAFLPARCAARRSGPHHQHRVDLGPAGDGGAHRLLRRQARRRRAHARAGRGAARRGIAVNAVCPGSVDTDMLRVGMPGAQARTCRPRTSRAWSSTSPPMRRRRSRARAWTSLADPPIHAAAHRDVDADALAAALRRLPLFPLPGVVLFPHALLPLHIFEERYRAMARDVLPAALPGRQPPRARSARERRAAGRAAHRRRRRGGDGARAARRALQPGGARPRAHPHRRGAGVGAPLSL